MQRKKETPDIHTALSKGQNMSLIELVKEAGVIGCGGAGFPTHVKFGASAGHLIVNGIECEPLLCSDRYLMREYAARLVNACVAVAEAISASRVSIALKETYAAEASAIDAAIRDGGADVSVEAIEGYYPAGDEHNVVFEITGRTVPYGGIPLDVGVVVSNVATMIAVSRALEGKPLIKKHITIAGEVEKPTIVHAPIGTPITECIDLAGGFSSADCFVVTGGPMMGRAIPADMVSEATVTKTTSGILALKKGSRISDREKPIDLQKLRKQAASCCIQCNYCTMLCPRYLLGHPLEPHKIMRALSMEGDIETLLGNETVRSASICSLCGVCSEYACPMGLMPSKVNAYIRREMSARGIPGLKGVGTSPLRIREMRKVPSRRISSRSGVVRYENHGNPDVVKASPRCVSIDLHQGIGVLPELLVETGSHVELGQMIARCPDGSIGSNLHASISGTVTGIGEAVRIEEDAL
jgi:Na+-translocating ferredoxin:NAD+ oxidoreductase RnfC subunit